MSFHDRADAGRLLADALVRMPPDAVVMALPNGGVPVAAALANRIGHPLDLAPVARVCDPSCRDLVIGGVGRGGTPWIDFPLVQRLAIGAPQLHKALENAHAEIAYRLRAFSRARPRIPLEGRPVILIDDVLAFPWVALAAADAVRAAGARVLAIAVGAADREALREAVEHGLSVYPLATDEGRRGAATFYESLPPVQEADVFEALRHQGTVFATASGAPV